MPETVRQAGDPPIRREVHSKGPPGGFLFPAHPLTTNQTKRSSNQSSTRILDRVELFRSLFSCLFSFPPLLTILFGMRKGTFIIAGFAAVLLAGAGPALAAATDNDAPPASVTLSEAIRITLERSRDLRIAADDVAIAREGKVKANARLLPRLDAAADYTTLSQPPSVFINGLQVQTADQGIFRTRVTAEQVLYDFGRTRARRSRADARVDAALEGEDLARERQAVATIAAFLAAKRAEELRGVATESLATAKAHLKVTQDNYDLGVVAKNDVLASEVAVANAEAVLIAAENRVELSRSRLALRMGYSGDRSVAPAGGDFPVPREAVPAVTDSVKTALEKRGEIKARAAAVREAEASVSAARSELTPTLLAQGGHSYETNDFNPHKSVFSFLVGGKVNLFSGFADEASVREAKAFLESRKEALAQTKDSIALEVKAAHLSLAEAGKRLTVAKVAVARAEENLRIQNDRYAEGLSINTEVLDAQTLLTRAKADEKNATYDLYEDRYGLLFARGELMEFLASQAGTSR